MGRPCLAPDGPDDPGHRRSLVLAGGGMRVAYQAGVLVALHEAGLRFHHADGASGGTINLSMLLTGQSPAEMCDRWRSLNPRHFSAPLPWVEYVRSPHWPGLGGGTGIRDKVFPHLGIDPDRIHDAEGMTGTYNVANFATKTAEVIEHRSVDMDLLVAAISLPVLMPAVKRQGTAYTDAVWIRDSNVPEAVRRGSDDIWLVWCIGNTPGYRNGSFRQYVHMIEMAASGSLFADLDRVATAPGADDIRLHVIKPACPLPLDPDYFLGRIDAASLIGVGYRDARAYLRDPRPLRAPWGPEVSKMKTPAPGAAARLVLEGPFTRGSPDQGDRAGTLRLHLRLETGATNGTRPIELSVVGDVLVPGWNRPRPVESGRARVGDPAGFELDLDLSDSARTYRMTATPGRIGLEVTLRDLDVARGDPGDDSVVGTGVLPFGLAEATLLLASIHPTNAPSLSAGWRARSDMARTLWRAVKG